MPSIRTAFPALVPVLIALALGACGRDDNEDSGKSADAGKAKTQTTSTSGASAQDNPREITSCLGKAGLNVIVNPGSVVDADYQLVVNSGGAGVLYGFADNTKATAAKAKVNEYEGSSGRKIEVIGDTVFAYFPARPDTRRAREVRQGPHVRPLGRIATRRREEAYAGPTG